MHVSWKYSIFMCIIEAGLNTRKINHHDGKGGRWQRFFEYCNVSGWRYILYTRSYTTNTAKFAKWKVWAVGKKSNWEKHSVMHVYRQQCAIIFLGTNMCVVGSFFSCVFCSLHPSAVLLLHGDNYSSNSSKIIATTTNGKRTSESKRDYTVKLSKNAAKL